MSRLKICIIHNVPRFVVVGAKQNVLPAMNETMD
jgi:hypothetical protein